MVDRSRWLVDEATGGPILWVEWQGLLIFS